MTAMFSYNLTKIIFVLAKNSIIRVKKSNYRIFIDFRNIIWYNLEYLEYNFIRNQAKKFIEFLFKG